MVRGQTKLVRHTRFFSINPVVFAFSLLFNLTLVFDFVIMSGRPLAVPLNTTPCASEQVSYFGDVFVRVEERRTFMCVESFLTNALNRIQITNARSKFSSALYIVNHEAS